MKANELRIGNYILISVLDGDKFVDELFTVSSTTIRDAERYGNEWNAKPVPLTEEWLLKFGWVWNKEIKAYEKYPDGDARMDLVKEVGGSYTMFNYVLKALIVERIWFVHQLQNLYFDLKREELIIISERKR